MVVLKPQSAPPGWVLAMNSPVGTSHSTAVYALSTASVIAPSAAPSIRAEATVFPPRSATAAATRIPWRAASARTPSSSRSAGSSPIWRSCCMPSPMVYSASLRSAQRRPTSASTTSVIENAITTAPVAITSGTSAAARVPEYRKTG